MPTHARTALTVLLGLLLAGLFTTSSAVGAAAVADGTPYVAHRGTSTDAFERQTIQAVNAVRAKRGLKPIRRVIPCLDGLSEDWGRRIVDLGLWQHRDQPSVVRTCRLAWTGETLARGSFTPASLVQAWMDSPPHRAILLTDRARLAGIDVRGSVTGGVAAVLNLGDRR